MNWLAVFTVLSITSWLIAWFWYWVGSDKYNTDGVAILLSMFSAGWAILWTALAVGAWLA